MKKLVTLLLVLSLCLGLLPAVAEETGLLDTLMDGIEAFDPAVDELLTAPQEKSLKDGLTLKRDISAPRLGKCTVSYANLCTSTYTTYYPAAALILDAFEYMEEQFGGYNWRTQNIVAYAGPDDYYEQLLVVVLDYDNDEVQQLWWTPGESKAEVYWYGDDDGIFSVSGFLNSESVSHLDELTRLDKSTLMSYFNQIEGGGTSQNPLQVGTASFRISDDQQHIYVDRPAISGGSGNYSIAYNIYDNNSQPVNYFYSNEEHVAATPGYGGLFNVFIVVTDTETGENNTQNIGWQTIKWPYASRLTVGKVQYELSPDGNSIYLTRPAISCRGGEVTIAYNIYDQDSNPVNYFYSTLTRVAATPGYSGRFNVFVVVTDTVTGEQNTQDIGWQDLGSTASGTYRALVVGNSDFQRNQDLICCKYDADHMVSMLQTINGGAYNGHITRKDNVVSSTLNSAIKSAYAGTQANDVSLFYISSHGVVYENGVSAAYAGAVAMSDDNVVQWSTLASWLKSANAGNKIIVIVDTCGSGGPVTSYSSGSSAQYEELMSRSVISAFAAIDSPITVKGVHGQEKLGELRTSQFEVVVACRANETSLGGSTGSLFTNGVIKGIGSGSSMPADTNKDGTITTTELHAYAYSYCGSSHHPMMWPSGSTYPLFWR